MSRGAFILFCIFIGPLAVGAQQAPSLPPPPRPPFIQTPATGSRWSVQIARDNPSAAAAQNGALTTAKSPRMAVLWEMILGKNQIGRATINYSDGTKDEFYTAQGHVLEKCSNSDRIALWIPKIQVGSQDLRILAFPAVEWLSLNSYAGIEKINKRDCIKFQMAPDYVAWIDLETHYPLRVKKLDKVYNFSLIQPFPNDVELPPNYLAPLSQLKSEVSALRMMKPINMRVQ